MMAVVEMPGLAACYVLSCADAPCEIVRRGR